MCGSRKSIAHASILLMLIITRLTNKVEISQISLMWFCFCLHFLVLNESHIISKKTRNAEMNALYRRKWKQMSPRDNQNLWTIQICVDQNKRQTNKGSSSTCKLNKLSGHWFFSFCVCPSTFVLVKELNNVKSGRKNSNERYPKYYKKCMYQIFSREPKKKNEISFSLFLCVKLLLLWPAEYTLYMNEIRWLLFFCCELNTWVSL